MKIDPAKAPVSGEGGVLTLHLSVAGGLGQFGAYIDTLQAGAFSSHRHWHTSEDEFLYVLEGTATLRDDDGLHDLSPGDALCWPHGCPNAHHITNRTDAPCRYVIVGSRVAGDICHYPDDGRKQVNGATTWQVLAADGSTLRGGDLPPELLNLPPVWGTAFDPARPGERVLRNRPVTPAADTPHPVLGGGLGPYSTQLLSDPGGLTQFGAFIEELPAGSRSGFRHWHMAEDEMIYMLAGQITLIEDTETTLHPGDAAAWPAGVAIGHCLANRSDQPARYLVIGTRFADDVITYTDHDLVTTKSGPARHYARRDGTPYATTGAP